MENENKATFGNYFGVIFFVGVVLGCFLYFWLYDYSRITALLVCVGLILVGIGAYILSIRIRSVAKMEKAICKCLDEQGYRHEKKDGTLFVLYNENAFHIHIWDTSNKRIKRLYFVYDFDDERRNNITKEGWLRTANRINVDNPHVTFVVYDESFQLRYETAIGSVNDFMLEFDIAYQLIGEAMDEFNKICPYLERDYSNTTENKANIGFVQNRE